MKPLRNITGYDSPMFQGFRVQRSKNNVIFRQYVSVITHGNKALKGAKELLIKLNEIIESPKSWKKQEITRKAEKALTAIGFSVTKPSL